jgi:hypothetical protein
MNAVFTCARAADSGRSGLVPARAAPSALSEHADNLRRCAPDAAYA